MSEQQIDLSRVPAGHGGDPSPAPRAEHGSIGLPVGSTTAMWGLLAAFVAVWFAYGAIADAGKAVQIDLAEAYVWGREFQLGYNQHPPFWAWIAGVWFMAFPRTNWAFVPARGAQFRHRSRWCVAAHGAVRQRLATPGRDHAPAVHPFLYLQMLSL